jgi:hypothetical protein
VVTRPVTAAVTGCGAGPGVAVGVGLGVGAAGPLPPHTTAEPASSATTTDRLRSIAI